MKPVQIGRDADSNPVLIDLARLTQTRLYINAGSGGGKSWTIRRLIEIVSSQVPFLLVDPEGEFSTLREKVEAVVVGEGGELDPRQVAPESLARKMVELRCSVILDVSEMKMPERRSYIRRMFETMIDVPKELRSSRLVLLDEAHEFCPESGEAESTDAVVDMANKGRKRGYAVVLASQRISRVSKDALSACRNQMLGAASLDLDVTRCGATLGMGAKDAQKFRHLQSGQFFAYGPAFNHAGVRLFTVDAVETTHETLLTGKRKKRAHKPPAPSARLVEIADQLRAQAKSDDPLNLESALKVIAQLKKDMKKMESNAARGATDAINELVTKARQEGADDAKRAAGKAYAPILRELANTAKQIRTGLESLERGLGSLSTAADTPLPPAPSRQALLMRTPARAPSVSVEDGVGLSGPQTRILNAIAFFESVGEASPRRAAVAVVARYSPTSSAFTNPLSSLRSAGLIEYPNADCLRMTDAGRGRAVADGPESRAEFHSRLLAILPGPDARILKPLIENGGEPMAREDNAKAAGYSPTSSAYTNPLSALRSRGLIEYPNRDSVAALPVLFPEGLR